VAPWRVEDPTPEQDSSLGSGLPLRRLQAGEKLSLPWSRPMPSIGPRCHELRIHDEKATWRIVYRIDSDAIVIVDVFQKQTQQTPRQVIDTCKRRLRQFDEQGG
jgi:phage-related protein